MNVITREQKINWLNDQYNKLKETNLEDALIVYAILKENVINQQTGVLKLA